MEVCEQLRSSLCRSSFIYALFMLYSCAVQAFAEWENIGLKAALRYSWAEIFRITQQRQLKPYALHPNTRRTHGFHSSVLCSKRVFSFFYFYLFIFFASTGWALRWYGEDEEDKETSVVNAPLQPDRRRVPVRTGGADDHRGWGH